MRPTIKKLRKDFPQWKWRAEHYGMGWRYIGEKDSSVVTIQAFAMICGPLEDDYATVWRVLEEGRSETYAAFCLRHTK